MNPQERALEITKQIRHLEDLRLSALLEAGGIKVYEVYMTKEGKACIREDVILENPEYQNPRSKYYDSPYLKQSLNDHWFGVSREDIHFSPIEAVDTLLEWQKERVQREMNTVAALCQLKAELEQ